MRTFIDSNIFVYILFKDPNFGKRALEILDSIKEGFTSTLVITQVLAHLERRKKEKVIPDFMNYMLNSNITVIETLWDDIIGGIELLKSKNLSFKMWDDAIIVSQMRRVGIERIYSNDKDFDSLGVKREF